MTILREHAFDRVLNDELGMTLPLQLKGTIALAANKAGEEHVAVLLFLLAGQDHLFRIDDYDVVAGVDVRGVGGFRATANDIRSLHGETAEHHTLGIDQIPLGLRQGLVFGEERFHEKRGQEVGLYEGVSTAFPRDKKPATANAGRVRCYLNRYALIYDRIRIRLSALR
jgi:hypothetical protein